MRQKSVINRAVSGGLPGGSHPREGLARRGAAGLPVWPLVMRTTPKGKYGAMPIRDWTPGKLATIWVVGMVVTLVLYLFGHHSYWLTAPAGITLAYGLLILALPLALLVVGFIWFRGWKHRKRMGKADAAATEP